MEYGLHGCEIMCNDRQARGCNSRAFKEGGLNHRETYTIVGIMPLRCRSRFLPSGA